MFLIFFCFPRYIHFFNRYSFIHSLFSFSSSSRFFLLPSFNTLLLLLLASLLLNLVILLPSFCPSLFPSSSSSTHIHSQHHSPTTTPFAIRHSNITRNSPKINHKMESHNKKIVVGRPLLPTARRMVGKYRPSFLGRYLPTASRSVQYLPT